MQFLTCSTLGCPLAPFLLFRILGQVRSVQAFVGDLPVGARASLYRALFTQRPSWQGGPKLGWPARRTQFGGRSEVAAEMEPGRSWCFSRGQMMEASCAGLPPHTPPAATGEPLLPSMPLPASWPVLQRGFLLFFCGSLPQYYCH